MFEEYMPYPSDANVMMRNDRVWAGWVDGEKCFTTWGKRGGKFQLTENIPGPKGKEGTKAFQNSEETAWQYLIRELEKKSKSGWSVETITPEVESALNDKMGEQHIATEITFDGPLPTNLCFSKPVNELKNDAEFERLCAGEGVFTVKMNGMMHIVSKDKYGEVYIQTRGKMDVVNEKYPHLVDQFYQLLPNKSICLCEFIVGEGSSKKDFKMMQSIANSKGPRALEMQEKYGLASAYLIRTPYWSGMHIEGFHTIEHILMFIECLWDGRPNPIGEVRCPILQLPDIQPIWCAYTEGNPNLWEELCEERDKQGWEGFVLYRLKDSFGEKGLNFKGNPDRPPVCWKVKPAYEDDFIAIFDPLGPPMHCSPSCHFPIGDPEYNGRCPICGKKLLPDGGYGTGKNKYRVGALSLYQLTPDGESIYICEASSGLSEEQKESIVEWYEDGRNNQWSSCVRVTYRDRGYVNDDDDSNALSFPAIDEIRSDKTEDECINEKLYL